MPTDGEAEDICGFRQGESVDCNIVGGNRLLREWKLLKYVGLEDWTRSCTQSVSAHHIHSD